ncbi:MAG: DUF3053 family protein [Beijerinckiaceae bacterium]
MFVTPQRLMREVIPPSLGLLDSEIAIADFVIAHQADIVVSGNTFQVAKPEVRKELQKPLGAYNAKIPQLKELHRKVDSVTNGG